MTKRKTKTKTVTATYCATGYVVYLDGKEVRRKVKHKLIEAPPMNAIRDLAIEAAEQVAKENKAAFHVARWVPNLGLK